MRLTLSKALALALLASVLPACDRAATDQEEAASKGTAPGQAGEGSTKDREAPSPGGY